MKVILYMATSANGYIGHPDGNSDWVSEADETSFLEHISSNKVVIMGRETYDVNKDFFPFPNALNVVLTRNNNLHKENDTELFTDKSPNEVLTYLETRGYSSALLIGGRETNTAFFEDNLIDEIKLIVHPLIFGDGMQLFHNSNKQINLELLNSETLYGYLVSLHYKVLK